MAARTPRRSFATPFVVTLAAVPACYVTTTPPPPKPLPSGPPPAQQPAPQWHAEPAPGTQPPPPVTQTPPPSTTQPSQQGPVVVANPPPPSTQPSQPPVRPDPRPAKPPQTTPPQESRWTVYKAKDGCMAAIKVECQPKATCNPPPPFKYACPDNVSLEKPVTVVSRDGTNCFVEYEMPSCPPGVACNPPRPQPVACPKR